MSKRLTTAERILEASRNLFNEKGYAATTVAEIAAEIGISQGNLTYHYPTKFDLVSCLEKTIEARMKARWATPRNNAIEDDYVEHLIFAMRLTWENRFMLRDKPQYTKSPDTSRANPYMLADLEELQGLLKRVKQGSHFRDNVEVDEDVLARTLWITSRYWLEHLRELEGMDRLTWADIERGVRHHFAVLVPYLTEEARASFTQALDGAMRYGKNLDRESANTA